MRNTRHWFESIADDHPTRRLFGGVGGEDDGPLMEQHANPIAMRALMAMQGDDSDAHADEKKDDGDDEKKDTGAGADADDDEKNAVGGKRGRSISKKRQGGKGGKSGKASSAAALMIENLMASQSNRSRSRSNSPRGHSSPARMGSDCHGSAADVSLRKQASSSGTMMMKAGGSRQSSAVNF